MRTHAYFHRGLHKVVDAVEAMGACGWPANDRGRGEPGPTLRIALFSSASLFVTEVRYGL